MTDQRPSSAFDERPVVFVASDPDPVATAVLEVWGNPPATGWHVDGANVRQFHPRAFLLRRPGRHIHDECLDERLPAELAALRPTLIFPSIHRSSQNVRALTVHPLGNPGPDADVGGRPRTLVPTDPRRMVGVLRALHEGSSATESVVTFESTHHGPELGLPAFFAEIGFGGLERPPEAEVRLLARALLEPAPAPASRVAMGVGGGHYAPHFTDLALRREWSFGHLISRHALEAIDRTTVEAAYAQTPGAEGMLFARAADQELEAVRGIAPRLRDQDAPGRAPAP
jgi:D-tyrosyl-tRNA(Tyr) deacylase